MGPALAHRGTSSRHTDRLQSRESATMLTASSWRGPCSGVTAGYGDESSEPATSFQWSGGAFGDALRCVAHHAMCP